MSVVMYHFLSGVRVENVEILQNQTPTFCRILKRIMFTIYPLCC